MFASIAKVTIDRARNTQALRMADGLVSQWLSVGEYRSCFCIATQAVPSAWLIEGRYQWRERSARKLRIRVVRSRQSALRNDEGDVWTANSIRCSENTQTNSRLWVVLKS